MPSMVAPEKRPKQRIKGVLPLKFCYLAARGLFDALTAPSDSFKLPAHLRVVFHPSVGNRCIFRTSLLLRSLHAAFLTQ